MSPSKRKKGREGPRDLRHRRVVFFAGSSLLKSPSSTIARGAVSGSSSSHISSYSRGLDGSFSLDLQRVVSVYSCGAKLNNVELEKINNTSVISHSLKRNANASNL